MAVPVRVGVHTGTNTTFLSTVTTASWAATAGNMLIAIAEADTVTQNGITITGNNGAIFTRVISTNLSGIFDLEIWVAVNIPGGAGQTVTAADIGGGVDSLIIVEEWSGAANYATADKFVGATNNTGSSTALNSGTTAATLYSNEVVISAGVVAGNVTMTAGTGYTNLTKINTTFSTLAFESKTITALAAQTGTMTAGTAGSWICQVATFRSSNESTITF